MGRPWSWGVDSALLCFPDRVSSYTSSVIPSSSCHRKCPCFPLLNGKPGLRSSHVPQVYYSADTGEARQSQPLGFSRCRDGGSGGDGGRCVPGLGAPQWPIGVSPPLQPSSQQGPLRQAPSPCWPWALPATLSVWEMTKQANIQVFAVMQMKISNLLVKSMSPFRDKSKFESLF